MTGTAPLAWLCVNLKSGGTVVDPGGPLLRRHGSLSMEWLRRFPEIVNLSPNRPQVIFLQEAKGFDHYGDELLLYVERLLRTTGLGTFRGFLTRSHRSHHHQVVFIDVARLQAAHHWHGADPDDPSGRYEFVEAIVDGDEQRTVWLKSVHLDPRDGDRRLADARQIHFTVPHDQRAMVAGDFNSITSRRAAEHGEPQRRFAELVPAHRYGKGHLATHQDRRRHRPGHPRTGLPHRHRLALPAHHRPQHHPNHGAGLRPRRRTDHRPLPHPRRLDTVPRSVWVDTSNLPYSDHRALGGAISILHNGSTR